jgi:surface antigen
MGLVVFLAVVGALTIHAFHILFDAPGWGFVVAFVLFILGMNASPRSQTEEQRRVRSLPLEDGAGMQRSLALSSPASAVMASMAVIVGIGVGWLLWGRSGDEPSAGDFVEVQKRRLLATAPLKAVLETVPSGRALVPLGGGKDTQFRATMTFQNQTRAYCRQYELTRGGRARLAGIACRIPSGDWMVMLEALLPLSASGVTVPASAGQNAALDAAIGALIDGDPLVGEAEAAIMRNGWTSISK